MSEIHESFKHKNKMLNEVLEFSDKRKFCKEALVNVAFTKVFLEIEFKGKKVFDENKNLMAICLDGADYLEIQSKFGVLTEEDTVKEVKR